MFPQNSSWRPPTEMQTEAGPSWARTDLFKGRWTASEVKSFTDAFAMVGETFTGPDLWDIIGCMIGKPGEEVYELYRAMEFDAEVAPEPCYKVNFDCFDNQKQTEVEPRVRTEVELRVRIEEPVVVNTKGTRWSAEEHKKFELGLREIGKGHWKRISKFIQTRTPTQVASHAQKYFKRLNTEESKRKRPSINDTTLDHELQHDQTIRRQSQHGRHTQSQHHHPTVFLQYQQQQYQHPLQMIVPNSQHGNGHNDQLLMSEDCGCSSGSGGGGGSVQQLPPPPIQGGFWYNYNTSFNY